MWVNYCSHMQVGPTSDSRSAQILEAKLVQEINRMHQRFYRFRALLFPSGRERQAERKRASERGEREREKKREGETAPDVNIASSDAVARLERVRDFHPKATARNWP